MTRKLQRRAAFTLVELLVVMTIIGMLMALLLPAVQNARESGRRTACSNSEYQISMGTMRYEEATGLIPGWRNRSPNPNDAITNNTVSWPVVLLPFIERTDIYNEWTRGNVSIQTSPYIPAFVCPSSPPDALTQPTLSYAGNCGSAANLRKWDGVMGDATQANGRMSLDDVADGTSTTVLITERCGPGNVKANTPLHQTWWDRRNLPANTFMFANVASYSAQANAPVPGIGIAGSPGSVKIINNITNNAAPGFWSQPSSNHPGGVVTVFCDGHTAFVKDTVASHVYAQLLSSNYSEAIRPPTPTNPNPSYSSILLQWLRTPEGTLYFTLKESDYQ